MTTWNQSSFDGDAYPGHILYNIKETLVAEGWSVRGSGDGGSRHGDIEAATTVPGAQQGSGGDYDCWTSASEAASGVAGGAGNQQAWCWLRDPNGERDVLLTAGDASAADTEGRIGYARKGAGGFTGGSTSATAFPAAPSTVTDEYWAVGSRAADGTLRTSLTSASTVYSVVVARGAEFLWWAYEETSGTYTDAGAWAGIFQIIAANPDMPDEAVYAAGDPVGASPLVIYEWISPTWFAFDDAGFVDFVPAGKTLMNPVFAGSIGQCGVGVVIHQQGTALSRGDRVELDDGSIYIRGIPGSRYMARWPDKVTDLPGTTPTDYLGSLPFGTREADSLPPTVALVSPAVTQQIGRQTPIVFDVVDETALATVVVSVEFSALGVEEVAYRDGQATAAYEVTIAGNRYTVRRRVGWPSDPKIVVTAVDNGGNLAV